MDFNKLLNVIDNGIALLAKDKNNQRKSTISNSPTTNIVNTSTIVNNTSTGVNVPSTIVNVPSTSVNSQLTPIISSNVRFFNDYHVVLDFGKYSGQKIMDLPSDYIEWIMKNHKYGPVYEALVRIENRRRVTSLISNMNVDSYIPNIKEWDVLVNITRPPSLDPGLYGSFIEYLAKYAMGLRKNDEVTELMAMFGYAEMPSHLKLTNGILPANKRIEYIHGSYEKKDKSPADLCNLSFAHSLMTNKGFNEDEAAKLFKYVKANETYYNKYIEYIKMSPYMPKLLESEQETCDKISVGCVVGVIDAISYTEIIDIKCCSDDNIDYYRNQLFTYTALHRLRHGPKITNGKIINFLTGKIFTMDFFGISDQIMAEHIKKMGNHCQYHIKLFT